MANVYLAEDVKHKRKVAVKVLRPELAAVLGADRFVQEITTTASLQHPNILPLFDSGEADGFLYYVMPYIEGETLRERLDRDKQLGIDEAVKITIEVAEALDSAHRQGVIHRDIKPENILLHDGRALVADFGIALAVSAAAGGRMTETGLTLGTPHYMSPEQATAEKDITARSDIYSLGSVLYEMLAGHPPHTGPTAQATLAKIVSDRPRPLRELRDTVPPVLDAAVQKALAKLPADRFATASRFGEALSRAPVYEWPGVPAGTQPRGRWHVVVGTVVVAIIALVAGAVFGARTSRSPIAGVTRFAVPLTTTPIAARQSLAPSLALSPDGTTLVYRVTDQDGVRLVVRPMDRLDATAIPGTEGASSPFFSRDSRWLGFVARDSLWKVALDGGPPLLVGAVTANVTGATWVSDDVILFTPNPASGVHRFAAGEPARQLSTPRADRGEAHHAVTDVLPGEQAALVTIWLAAAGRPEIGTVNLATGEVKTILENGSSPRFVPPDHLVFAQPNGTLMVAPFDAGRRALTGPPVPLIEGVTIKPFGFAEFATSRSGQLVYLPGTGSARSLKLIDRNGAAEELELRAPDIVGPRFSPDGRRIAFSSGVTDIWVFELATATLSRFTLEGNNWYPAWSPDGRVIVYTSTRAGGYSLFTKPLDGTSVAEPLPGQSAWVHLSASWAPNGRTVVYRRAGGVTGGADIGVVAIGDRGRDEPLIATSFDEWSPTISPNGRWLAYVSDESGADEIYVRPYPEVEAGKWKVSQGGGTEPAWAPNGQQLFYRTGLGIVAADVRTEPTFIVESRRVLFDHPTMPNRLHTNYDVHPNGTKFVMVGLGDQPTELIVVLNWLGALANH